VSTASIKPKKGEEIKGTCLTAIMKGIVEIVKDLVILEVL